MLFLIVLSMLLLYRCCNLWRYRCCYLLCCLKIILFCRSSLHVAISVVVESVVPVNVVVVVAAAGGGNVVILGLNCF